MKGKFKLNHLIVHLILLVGVIVVVFPFAWMILTSFKTSGEAMKIPPTIFPEKFVTTAYHTIVTSAIPFVTVYMNTIINTVVTTLVQIVFCSMAGYAFGRIEFPFKNAIFILVLSVLMVPGQIFLLPQYQIVQKLGLLDTIPALFLPNLFSAFGTFLLRQFFMSLPKELEEAAIVDGCGRFRIFAQIMLPLIKPGIVAMSIFTIKFAWNDFMWPLIVNNSMDKLILGPALSTLQGQHTTQYPRRRLKSARSALTRSRFRPPEPAWSGSCNTEGSFWSRPPSQCCGAQPPASEYRFQSPQWHNSCPWGFPVFSVKCGSPPPCCSLSERFPDNALPGALQ